VQGGIGNFTTKLVAMATSLELALLRVKKKEKKKKLTQAKYIAFRQVCRAG